MKFAFLTLAFLTVANCCQFDSCDDIHKFFNTISMSDQQKNELVDEINTSCPQFFLMRLTKYVLTCQEIHGSDTPSPFTQPPIIDTNEISAIKPISSISIAIAIFALFVFICCVKKCIRSTKNIMKTTEQKQVIIYKDIPYVKV